MAAAILSACDPGHPFVDLRTTVLLPGDGTAVVRVTTQRPAAGTVAGAPEEAFRTALALALAEGLHLGVVGPVRTLPPDAGLEAGVLEITIAAVPSADATVHVDDLLTAAKPFGYTGSSTAFVSLCVPYRRGAVTGVAVESQHYGSCATWEGTVADAVAHPTMTARFRARRPPWRGPLTITATTFLATAIVAALAILRRRHAPAAAVASTAAAVTLVTGLVTMAKTSGGSWFTTGQTIDTYLDGQMIAVAGGAGLATFVLAALAWALFVLARRRRLPVRPGPWGPPTGGPA